MEGGGAVNDESQKYALSAAIKSIKDADAAELDDCCTCDAMKVVEALEELRAATTPQTSAWTKEQPTVPGVYWFRGKARWAGGGLSAFGTELIELRDNGEWYCLGWDGTADHFPPDCEWCGPLAPPEPTKAEAIGPTFRCPTCGDLPLIVDMQDVGPDGLSPLFFLCCRCRKLLFAILSPNDGTFTGAREASEKELRTVLPCGIDTAIVAARCATE